MRMVGAVACVFAGALAIVGSAHGQVPTGEREALLSLFESTNGEGWIDSQGWGGPAGTECAWYGVGCDESGSNVVSLSLQENGLTGSIPEEIGDLPFLRFLHLYRNALTGEIPHEVGRLSRLEVFMAGYNRLTGQIPLEVGSMSSLREFRVRSNQLSGTIPGEFGTLNLLEDLSLSENDLIGTIPPELGQLANLVKLNLWDNDLTGSIPPELGQLGSVEEFYLQQNRLSGPIPSELGNLQSVVGLYLNSNRLEGPVPDELGELVGLKRLRLYSNSLRGAIPRELTNLSGIEDGGADLRWNALTSDDENVIDFLERVQFGGDWQSTQTVAPLMLTATDVAARSAILSWEPIPYTWNTGGYEVYSAVSADGPYELSGRTPSKRDSEITIDDLEPGLTYYFKVRTVTDDHTLNQSSVESEFSDVVVASTPDVVCDLDCDASAPATTSVAQPVVFSGSVSVSGCTDSPEIHWDFGDAEHATVASPVHSYLFPHNYMWSFVVSAGGAACHRSGSIDVVSTDTTCGDNRCEPTETAWSCPTDCGFGADATGRVGERGAQMSIPAAVGGIAGVAGTYWVSEGMVVNPGDDVVSLEVSFVEDGGSGTLHQAGPIGVDAGEAVFWNNMVAELFQEGLSGSAIVSSTGPVIVSTRTFNDQPTGTYGQFLGGIRTSRALGPGDAAYVIGLSENTDFRTNLVLHEVAGRPAEALVSVWSRSGLIVAESIVAVPAGGKVQRRLTQLGVGDLRNGYARVKARGGQLVVIASVVDNRTGDAVTMDAVHPTQVRVAPGKVESSQSVPRQIVVENSSAATGFTWDPPLPEAGQQIRFMQTSHTDATEWRWDFGDGASSEEPQPYHTFSTPGDFTVVLVARGGESPILSIASVEVLQSRSEGQELLVPVVARATGAEGTRWRSDLWLMNPFESAQQVRLEYSPAGAGTVRIEQLEIGPSEQAAVLGVVSELFPDEGEGKGGLRIFSQEGLVASTRTYNAGAAGTYGQFIPALARGDLLHEGEVGWLAKLKHDVNTRCNIGFTAQDESGGIVEVELVVMTSSGVSTYGPVRYTVAPMENLQIDRVFQKFGVPLGIESGFATARVVSGGPLYVYASNIDNRTGDSEFIAAVK